MITWPCKPYNIIWVDNDPFFLAWITPQVTALPCFMVHTCGDAPTALHYLERANPDIILTNLVMPYICGLEMMTLIRSRDAHIPMVVVSARSQEYDRQAALAAGASAFISKAGMSGRTVIAGIQPYLVWRD
ncbi:response regulator [Chitinophaga qingshengii]|uniref:Response regulator n=1 Tax=Chitinophaga qingshengii TaxID=1569794 RepID=A0ABR7TER0_9BACT|nr:response regulator [Chitinophaga qingshengii]MBC9928757.1 response regulator [Chitinophaga qingshengii]